MRSVTINAYIVVRITKRIHLIGAVIRKIVLRKVMPGVLYPTLVSRLRARIPSISISAGDK